MAAIQRFFRPGQTLFREGDPSNCMFLIKKGTVAVRKRKGAAQVEIARIYANEVIGELSFFDRLPRSAGAVALTEVEALEIQFKSLDSVYAQVPDYMKTIIASLADRLRKADDMIRRLQKNVVAEGAEEPAQEDGPSSSDVLASAVQAPALGKEDGDGDVDHDLKKFDAILAEAAAESGVDTELNSEPSDSDKDPSKKS